MTTADIKKKWQKWDEATIDSYRIQFRVIDINEDGLIDFHELYIQQISTANSTILVYTAASVIYYYNIIPLDLLYTLRHNLSIGALHWMK